MNEQHIREIVRHLIEEKASYPEPSGFLSRVLAKSLTSGLETGVGKLGTGLAKYSTDSMFLEKTDGERNSFFKKGKSKSKSLTQEYLEETYELYYPKYLSYSLYMIGRESNLSFDDVRKLDRKYGEVLAEPVIDWPRLIKKLDNTQVDNLENDVKDFILSHGGKVYGNREYFQMFETFMKDKATKEATKIIGDLR